MHVIAGVRKSGVDAPSCVRRSPRKHAWLGPKLSPQKRKIENMLETYQLCPVTVRRSPRKHVRVGLQNPPIILQESKRRRTSKALDFANEKKKVKPCKVCKKLDCGPCFICHKKHRKYFHLRSTNRDSILYRNIVTNFPLMTEVDSFCDSCRSQYKSESPSLFGKPSKRKIDRPKCFLDNCDNISSTKTPSVSDDTFNGAFSVNCSSIPEKVDLCAKHYQLFKTYKNTEYCSLCKCVLGNVKTQRYLCKVEYLESISIMAAAVDDSVTLNAGDPLCRSCYRALYVTSDACSDLGSLSLKIHTCQIQCDKSDVQEQVVLSVCKIVCDLLIHDGAILLVDVYEKYIKAFHEHVNILGKADGITQYSRVKLLSEILFRFDNLLEIHTTSSTKQGKMLVYKKCDLKMALHKAVYKLHTIERKTSGDVEFENVLTDEANVTVSSESQKANLYCASLDFNNRLESQAKQISDHFASTPLSLKCLDFENLLTFIDPHVWNSMFIITSNEREKREVMKDIDMDVHVRLPMGVNDPNGDQNRKRFMRRLFGLFNMQFILNDEFNYPIHVINADVVKRLSNSSKLLHILNRVGFCVSDDTLERYLEIIACEKEKNSTRNLNLDAFTIVSIDNIDCLSPYAIMSGSGVKERSWHGTSVMAQQPQPNTDFLFPSEKISSFQRFSLLKVYGDGKCFYRCLAVYSTLSLRKCPRNAYGVPPSSGNLNSLETMLADIIQLGIRYLLYNNLSTLNSLLPSIKQSYLEKQAGVFYEDFIDCLNDHAKLGTYACTLQIVTAAYAMRTQIHIYQLVREGYELIAIYPPDMFEDSYPVHVLHRTDSYGQPGHFDLLIDESESEFPTDVDDEIISVDSSLPDVFNQWQKINSEFITDCEIDLDKILHVSFGGTLASNSGKPKRTKKGKTRLRGKHGKRSQRKKKCKEPFFKTFIPNQIQLELFKPSCAEELATAGLLSRLFIYVLERYTIIQREMDINLPTLKCKLAAEDQSYIGSRGKSNFAFIEIYNDKADCTSTIKKVLHELHDTFKVSKHVNHLFVVGDLKTYEYVMKAKSDQGKAMDWVIPYIGDWHVLKNLQSVIMKIFWDGGLKDVSKVVHKGGSVLNLRNCQSFRHTHRFILQSYEALYLYQIDCFMKQRQLSMSNCQFSGEKIIDLLRDVVHQLNDADAEFTNISSFLEAQKLVSQQLMPNLLDDYLAWCKNMSKQHETFALWDRFLKSDVFAYIQLFISIRTGNWDLRQAAIKHVASLFHAFDHQNYARWLPVHLGQIYAMPEYVLLHFKNGSFVSSIKGINYSCVGFDEAHEMLINKMVKNVIIRNTPQNIARIASTLEYQAELVDNYVKQVAKAKPPLSQRDFSVSIIRIEHQNIKRYYEKWLETTVFHKTVSAQLYHAFTNKEAEPAVSNDLKKYYDIGHQSYMDYIRTQNFKRP